MTHDSHWVNARQTKEERRKKYIKAHKEFDKNNGEEI